MMANDILIAGVAQGIITAEQAERLRALETFREPPEFVASPDDEQLRFLSGFSDIFVTIGLALFLGATGYLAQKFDGAATMWITIAVAAWLLAEFFTRVRRMALPSIVLLIVFAFAAFMAASHLLGGGIVRQPHVYVPGSRPNVMSAVLNLDPDRISALGGAAFMTLLLTALHYVRFRVPITIAAGCAALTGTVVAVAFGLMPTLSPTATSIVIFVCGIAIFALAMQFDMSDRERLTRRTDIAFWLHLLAAPLIVHSLIRGIIGANTGKLDPESAVVIMVVFLALSFVAVLIDRRAMLVSGLTYAGIAFWTLIRQAGLSDMTTPFTILALGAFVLLLSAGWRPLRAAILSMLPAALTQRLPQTSLSA
jgi:hypothetical protein